MCMHVSMNVCMYVHLIFDYLYSSSYWQTRICVYVCIKKCEGSDTEDIIAAVVQASSFEAMKEQAAGRDNSGAAQGHLRKGTCW